MLEQLQWLLHRLRTFARQERQIRIHITFSGDYSSVEADMVLDRLQAHLLDYGIETKRTKLRCFGHFA